MNVKISVFVICAEVIIYLLLYNLCNCTFNKITLMLFTDFLYKNNLQRKPWFPLGDTFLATGIKLSPQLILG